MWKVTRNGILSHKVRFVLTSIAVLLGVAFMTGTMVLGDTITHTFDDLFSDINRGVDAVVRSRTSFSTDFGPKQRGKIPAGIVDQVRAVPGVKDAQGVLGGPSSLYAQIVGKNGKAIGEPDAGPPTFGVSWDPNAELNPWELTPGSRPPETADEIVIDNGSAKKGKLKVGDRAKILTSQRPKEYQIVGTVKFGTVDSPLGASATVFTLQEAQRIAEAPGGLDQISILADSGISQSDIRTRVQQALVNRPDAEVITGAQLTKENQDDIHKVLGFITTAMFAFAVIALFVGAFIIYNTFWIIVAQRTRELALLRAVGASQRQVRGSVLFEALIVGLFASIVGVLVGIGLASGLKAVLAGFGFDIPASGTVLLPRTVIVGLVAGLVVTLLASFIPARRASRMPPVAAMRDVALNLDPVFWRRLNTGAAISIAGIVLLLLGLFAGSGIFLIIIGAVAVIVGVFVLAGLFAKQMARAIGAPIRRLKGITGELAKENAARNPKRTAGTAAALMVGVALVGFITIFATSAKKSVAAAIDKQFVTDYVVSAGKGTGGVGFSPQLGRDIAKLPVVDASMPVRFGPARVGTSSEFIVAADPVGASKLMNLEPEAGSLNDLTPDGIAISKTRADEKHWTVGTKIPVLFTDTGLTELRVQMIYKNDQIVGNYLMSLDGYDAHFKTHLDFFLFAKLKPGVTPKAGRAAIEPLVKEYPVAKLKDQAQFKKDQESQINQILNIVYVLLFFSIVIAVIGIAITLALSIYERTRELGLLRAVGMSRKQVRSAVRWESIIIALIGTFLGLLIGIFFGFVVVEALKDEGFNKFAIAPGQLLVVVILGAILGVVAAAIPARRASKIDMLRAIATE